MNDNESLFPNFLFFSKKRGTEPLREPWGGPIEFRAKTRKKIKKFWRQYDLTISTLVGSGLHDKNFYELPYE